MQPFVKIHWVHKFSCDLHDLETDNRPKDKIKARNIPNQAKIV